MRRPGARGVGQPLPRAPVAAPSLGDLLGRRPRGPARCRDTGPRRAPHRSEIRHARGLRGARRDRDGGSRLPSGAGPARGRSPRAPPGSVPGSAEPRGADGPHRVGGERDSANARRCPVRPREGGFPSARRAIGGERGAHPPVPRRIPGDCRARSPDRSSPRGAAAVAHRRGPGAGARRWAAIGPAPGEASRGTGPVGPSGSGPHPGLGRIGPARCPRRRSTRGPARAERGSGSAVPERDRVGGSPRSAATLGRPDSGPASGTAPARSRARCWEGAARPRGSAADGASLGGRHDEGLPASRRCPRALPARPAGPPYICSSLGGRAFRCRTTSVRSVAAAT